MDELLKQLVFQVQQYQYNTEERQEALIKLVKQILHSRPICRPPKGQCLSGIYLDIFQAVQQQLQLCVDQTIESYNPRHTAVRDWANGLRDSAFQRVLDNHSLTRLALEAQQHKPQTQQWQYALRELLNAVRLSGKLLHQRQFSADVYEDAVTRTLLWVCQNLNAYNPDKGKFMAWVNYRLDMIAREIQQEYKDPFIQSIQGKLIRNKYKLKAILTNINQHDLGFLLTLALKSSSTSKSWMFNTILILTDLLLLSHLIAKNSALGDLLLFEMSKQSFYLPSRLHQIPEKSRTLEEIAQPEEKPFLSETVRQYIESDPQKLFQKHIREYPQATFQAIALARLDGKTWREMSESFGIGIPALNNFFQRRLRELAPEIRRYVQEQSE